MAQFKFFLDEKVTVWQRTEFNIEANSEEEAKELAKTFLTDTGSNDIINSDDLSVGYVNSTILFDSIEPMSVKDNDGQATLELYCNGLAADDMVADNTSL